MIRHQKGGEVARKIANLTDERPWIGRRLSGHQVTGDRPAKAGLYMKNL
jgi:hypothetical protein